MTSPGAALRAMRPVKPYTCAVCGAGFTASDTRATYCSNRCAQAAKYARKQARLWASIGAQVAENAEKIYAALVSIPDPPSESDVAAFLARAEAAAAATEFDIQFFTEKGKAEIEAYKLQMDIYRMKMDIYRMAGK